MASSARVYVEVKRNESTEQLIRRFTKAVKNSKVLQLVNKKRFYTSKAETIRQEKKQNIAKARRKERMTNYGE